MLELYKKFYDIYSAKYGPNTAIFLMVGKFYELYDYIDAKTEQPQTSMRRAVELMNILLKEKPGEGPNGETALWGGIPEQSLHKFAQVLTRENWTVVVVDQVKEGDAVVDRIPTRILSPGTHVETATQDRMTLAALWLTEASAATSLVDLTTGEVFSYETQVHDDILHMYQVYGVREVVVTQASPLTYDEETLRSNFGLRCPVYQIPYSPKSNFEQAFAREEYLKAMFRVKGMLPVRSSLGLTTVTPQQELALCSLLRFLEDHFPHHTERLTSHEVYVPAKYMRLSNNILEQINFMTQNPDQRSVLSMVQRTHSAMGRRHLRERMLRPLVDSATLESRWAQVEWAMQVEADQRKAVERELKKLYDLPRLHFKIAEGSMDSTSILQLTWTYTSVQVLASLLRETNSPLTPSKELDEKIRHFREEFRGCFDERKAARLEKDSPDLIGFLTTAAGPQTAVVEQEIQALLDDWMKKWRILCKEMGIAPQDNEFQLLRKPDGGFVWEGSRQYLKAILARGQAVQTVTGFRVDHKKAGPIQVDCNEFEIVSRMIDSKMRTLNAYMKQESAVACDRLWSLVHGFQGDWVSWLGSVDATFALAAVARDFGWVKPQIGDCLQLEGLRHPILESNKTRAEYVKHDVKLGAYQGAKGWLIYGVNASGKSSLMKAVGIAVLLAQAGSFVPATHMVLRPYDAAFSRIWSHDNVWAGLSSFAVEVGELREILTLATSKSLVLGDEVCSGTESSSATAIVAAALEHLEHLGAHFLFATHLHDLVKIRDFLPRPGIAVWHLRVRTLPNGKLVYERTLQQGSGDTLYGLEVAKAMGLPFALMQRAHEIRRELEGEAAADSAPRSSWNREIQRRACEHCGHSFVPGLEVHHIEERARGGGNELRNLAVLCQSCHDKHHAGTITIPPLTQTSEGLERLPVHTEAKKPAVRVSMKKKTWTEEESRLIRKALEQYQSRPLTRVESALLEEGLKISVLQLKRFIQQEKEQEQEQEQAQVQ
jgi:DNA mismatch repair protein MutS